MMNAIWGSVGSVVKRCCPLAVPLRYSCDMSFPSYQFSG